MPAMPASTTGLALSLENRVDLTPRVHYIDHTFVVEPRATRVTAHLTFTKATRHDGQLFLALFDPHGFRGMRMNPSAVGEVKLELWVETNDAGEGALPGPLDEGTWRVMVDVNDISVPLTYRLDVRVEYGEPPAPALTPYPADHVVRHAAGWYRGELHAHSTESDGKVPVADVVQAAHDAGLDFFSLTDHFTVSQWRKLAPLVNGRMALLRSCELTSHHGHANLQGIHSWVDVYVDRPDWSMNDAADATHAQGGLFCVNHAYSGGLGWRAHEFDWAKCDLYEVYHNLEGANNNWQIPLWDRLLVQGYRIVGVAGIDTHDPANPTHALGQLVTWVYADELSERGILDGLRRGQVYLSRGPELRFHATNRAGAQAAMWETLPSHGAPITLTVDVRAQERLRLFVLRDGLLVDSRTLDHPGDAWQQVTLEVQPQRACYYRVELHTIPEATGPYVYVQQRDYVSFRAASNPILVEP